MKNRSFKAIRAAEAAALILSALLAAAACAAPALIADTLCEECLPLISSAREHIFSDEYSEAEIELSRALGFITEYEDLLMAFYGHADVTALIRSAKTAADLARAQDRPQFLQTIDEMEAELGYLNESNRAALRDVF